MRMTASRSPAELRLLGRKLPDRAGQPLRGRGQHRGKVRLTEPLSQHRPGGGRIMHAAAAGHLG